MNDMHRVQGVVISRADWREQVRRRTAGKLKNTRQGDVMMEVLADASHETFEELAVRAKALHPAIGSGTVNRYVRKLCELGLVDEVDLGEGRLRFEARRGPAHHHLVCVGCGVIEDFDDEFLADAHARAAAARG